MKKATNIIEVSQIFDPQKVLTLEDEEIHQKSIYENTMKPLRTKLIINQAPTKTFYLCGQIGVGKSTALNFLPNEIINKKYKLKYISGSELFSISDIDIIDILIVIGFEIIKNNKSLEAIYYEGLNKLKDTNLDTLKITKEQTWDYEKKDEEQQSSGIKTNIPIVNFTNKTFKNLKANQRERQQIREIFRIDVDNLIEHINDIISEYQENKDTEKDLLLIIDDLEKIVDKDIIQKLFVDNNWVFDKIKCVKIIPIHIFLPQITSMFNNDLFELDFRIESNQLDNKTSSKDDKKVEKNKTILKEIILSRLANSSLIEDDAYDVAIKYSGGNIRQLIEIIYQASINQLTISDFNGTSITKDDMIWGVEQISSRLSKAADSKIRMLMQVMTEHKKFDKPSSTDKENFDSLLMDNLIFLHKNGTHWYDINPIIKKTVEVHGKSSN